MTCRINQAFHRRFDMTPRLNNSLPTCKPTGRNMART